MIGPGTRRLLNGLSILLLVWIGYTIYCSVTNRGLWRTIAGFWRTFGGESTLDMAATFAVCVLAGVVPMAAVGWLIWRVFLHTPGVLSSRRDR